MIRKIEINKKQINKKKNYSYGKNAFIWKEIASLGMYSLKIEMK